jgi:hypothetical protein
MAMTRAEALCACRNILAAVEDLDEILPTTYATSVHDKVKSMSVYIMRTPQYPHVTERMDTAIRNIWTGLQKWNRKGEANSELFYGLANIITKVDEKVAGMPAEADMKVQAAGMEGSEKEDFAATAREMLGEFTAEHQRVLADMRAAAQHQTVGLRETAKPPPSELPPPFEFTRAKFLELATKARENVIAVAHSRYRDKGIKVLDSDKIKHGDLTPVLRLTTSERTRQCLEAAYAAGYIAGAKSTIEAFEELVRESGA